MVSKAKSLRYPLIGFWTAGNDIIADGNWVWAPDNEPMKFAPWGPGEPNEFGKEDCAGLLNFLDFYLNDADCNSISFFHM
ncbi:hypothetical protein CHS0354_033413 [Potamilus streckersoni]|uniref:C-type lectin domain-containing protein n=1 Tax=Potamilus streckersoni TaxID=2493646 RepID=A0AAE0VM10_9BIVA|nr:hypothetical protein CHS0354_033413 [Potamilus streckersoni]